MTQSNYSEKLKDPRWQKKRLEILDRDKWTCIHCGAKDRTLHVHHHFYIDGQDPWEYSDWSLSTLCDLCHESYKDGWATEGRNFLSALQLDLIWPDTIDCCRRNYFETVYVPQLLKDLNNETWRYAAYPAPAQESLSEHAVEIHQKNIILRALFYALKNPPLTDLIVENYIEGIRRELKEIDEKYGTDAIHPRTEP